MQIKSLGYRTDLIFPRFDGVVKERDNYLVIETPSNPHFHWGNYLLFREPPAPGALEEWRRLFKAEFGSNPEIKHITFGWDGTDGQMGASAEFVNAGFRTAEQIVLAANEVSRPKHFNIEVTVRPLTTDEDWIDATENQIACRDAIYEYGPYKLFKESQMKRYRSMEAQGLGHWFGAFINDQLVGSLGIYRDQNIGRFQNVGTNPEFRRQGICGTMVYLASEHAFSKMGIETLVMVSDEDGDARRVYESVGFKPREKQSGLSWWQG